jgi:multidrug transporter EmrE-like cation transporter
MKFNTNFILLLLTAIFLQSFSFLSIKISTLQEGQKIYLFLILAFIFMGFRAIIWQLLLKRSDLSIVYPFASLVQILILIYAVLFFNENVTVYNIIGLGLMLGGIYYLTTKKSV